MSCNSVTAITEIRCPAPSEAALAILDSMTTSLFLFKQ